LAKYPDDVSLALSDGRLQGIAQNLVTMLNSAVQTRDTKQIEFTEINALLKQLEASGYFPKAVTSDQAELAIQFFVTKVFAAPSAATDGLDALHVGEMQKFANRWLQLKTAYRSGDLSSVPELATAIQAPNWNLDLDASGRIQIPPSASTSRHGEFPSMFAVIEWLGQKWGAGAWPLSATAFHSVVTDALTLIHAFNYLAAYEDDVFERLLREANLFLPSSNGNMLLESSEAFQYALFALSSYRSSHALKALAKTCDPEDFACYQKILYANRTNLLSNVPSLLAWLGDDSVRYNAYTNSLKVISGTTYLTEFMVANYIETFMERFDQNKDGLIDLKDAMLAFPIYGPVLTDMLAAKKIPAEEIESIYTFLFSYGATPFSVYVGSVRYLYWKWHSDSWAFTADRKTLASILAELTKL